jgi:hypothetical protein
MNRKLARSLLSLTAAGALLGATGATALADALPQAPVMDEVFALEHTPHLFFLDEQGAVHLASDPQALAGIEVDWFARRDVTLDQLRQYTRGEPLLSLALVKIGDAIYLPEAPIGGGAPKLRLVKSIADLAALGIGGENYGRLVLEQGAWEARYGLRTADLPTEDLSLDGAPAVGPAMPQEPTPNEVASA